MDVLVIPEWCGLFIHYHNVQRKPHGRLENFCFIFGIRYFVIDDPQLPAFWTLQQNMCFESISSRKDYNDETSNSRE